MTSLISVLQWTNNYVNYAVARICHGEGNGTPLQYSSLENPKDGGA